MGKRCNLFLQDAQWLTNTRYYNKTKYSGLEIHISNSYANSLLQMMHFIPLLRNLALQHAATACQEEICLLCELGFLFDMLQKAEGSICQATNLLKALSNHPQGEFFFPTINQIVQTNFHSWTIGSSRGRFAWVILECDAARPNALLPGNHCSRPQEAINGSSDDGTCKHPSLHCDCDPR